MMKCTEAIFLQSSPSTFFRKFKRQNKQSEQYEITESQIIDRLQLILISMREEGAKGSFYLQSENKRLQEQAGYHCKLNELLEQENMLMANLLTTYIQKYGQIGPETQQLQTIKEAKAIFYQNNSIIHKQNFSQIHTPKNMDKQSTNLSTNYISQCHDKSNNSISKFLTQTQLINTSPTSSLMSSQHQKFGTNSTTSNFHKKSTAYNQSTPQNQSSHAHHNSSLRESQEYPTQISPNQPQHILNTNKLDSSDQDQEKYEYSYLGLDSRGSNFFARLQIQNQDDSTPNHNPDLVEIAPKYSSQPQQHRQSQDNLTHEQVFQPMKTDSDIKNMKLQLQKYFINIESQSKGEVCQNQHILNEISLNKSPDSINPNNINSHHSKASGFYGKIVSKQHDTIAQQKNIPKNIQTQQIQSMRRELRIVQKRLKALFQPLPPSIISKKVTLPKVNEELTSHYGRESVDAQRLNLIFNHIQTKALKSDFLQNKTNKKRINLKKQWPDRY